MADTVRALPYFALSVPDKAGEANRILAALARDGVNLLAFSGFPLGSGKAQIDLVPEDAQAFTRTAASLKLRVRKPKTVFLVQGDDRMGATAQLLARLAAQKIQVTAAQAVTAGDRRWGMVLWVKPGAVEKARRALGA